MFGPNTYFTDTVTINYSHRDKCFFELFQKAREKFSEVFGLEDYDILFVPGSATVGIEALLFSVQDRVQVIGPEGTFKSRWQDMLKLYQSPRTGSRVNMFCRLETSRSTSFSQDGCLVDAISAFPYYDVPEGTKAFVTCLNKQLGSYIGLSVVCVRKDYWENMLDDSAMSYLNLSRYRHYHDIGQTPSTAPTFIFEHLLKVLECFDVDEHRRKIDRVSDLIVDAVGEDCIIGEVRCPAITFKPKTIPEGFAREHDMYGYWAGRPNYQVFTYTQPEEDYERFAVELKAVMNRVNS